MKRISLVVLVGLNAACAQVQSPRALAQPYKTAHIEQVGAQCKAAIVQAEAFNDRTVERHGLGMVLSSVLGPLGLPINWVRQRLHDEEKLALGSHLQSQCRQNSVR